jgi:TolB protein
MRLFASRLDGSDARQVTDGSGVVWGARWSPDGKRLAFGSKDEQGALHVFLTNADGSARRQVTRSAPSGEQFQMPAWSPDASQFAVQGGVRGQPAHIWIVDAATGAARKLPARPGLRRRCPPGSPTASASPTRATGAAAWKSGS